MEFGQAAAVFVVGDNQRDIAIEFANAVAVQQVDQAVFVFGYKDGHARLAYRQRYLPLHIVLFGDGGKGGGKAVHRQGKAVQVPLHAHQEQVFHRVLVLVGVQDVGVIGQQEIGDGCNQAVAVRAADQQGGRMAVTHGLTLCL